jgi:predicted ATPase/DNA-binding winged helix-turn-helix (wHTH) protein
VEGNGPTVSFQLEPAKAGSSSAPSMIAARRWSPAESIREDTRPIFVSGECEIDLERRELRVGGSPATIGARSFEVVEVLVQSVGKLVTKDELMDRIWPGAVVMENTLQVHAGAIRRALGPYRNLLKTESRRGYRLLGNWSVADRDAANSPLRTASAQRSALTSQVPSTSNFPSTVVQLVGRSAALQRLQALVSAYRVVTLTGPGGIGKTALALEVARRALGAFSDGGRLVELAALSDPSLVAPAVAGALGLRLASDMPATEAVARAIGGNNLLLVLDNCEHVIDATAALAETLMRRCPRLTILATSREILRIEGEQAYHVPPLGVPTREQAEAGRTLDCSGPELFITRAAELGWDAASYAEGLPAIAAICRQLDGIPLAIELAAARAATLGVEPVAAALRDRFELLTGGRRTALPRHRTLRATLDWSHGLLTGPERLMLRRLAMFAGSFSLAAAHAVTNTDEAPEEATADRIASLIAKSLLTADITGGTGHFRLLETTRVYALAKLTESGELREFARRHAEYYRGLLETIEHEWEKRSLPLAHVDNIRAALEWCFGAGGDLALAVRLAAAAAPMFLAMSLLPESHRWAERAILALDDAMRGGPEEMHLQASLGISSMQMYGPNDAARLAVSRSLAIAETCGRVLDQVALLGTLSMFYVRDGDFKTSLHYARLSRAVEGAAEYAAATALANSILGRALQFVGDHDNSRAELEASFRYWSRSPDTAEVHLGLDHHILVGVGLARNFWMQGEPTRAEDRIRQTVKDAERKSHPASLGLALSWAPGIFLWVGDLETAEEHVDWLVSHAETHSLGPYLAVGRGYKGMLAIRRDEPGVGVENLRECLVQLHATRYEMLNSGFKLALARGLTAIGEFDEGLALVDETIRLVEANGDLLHMPEALRVKGRLLLAMPPGRGADAERCFMQSLDWSRRQAARSWELRTATDLARLWAAQGQECRARAILQPIFETFTEGEETADLRAAADLLAALR